jgi:hypothetical protein
MVIDPERAAVDAFNVLDDSEFSLICEYKELLKAGFEIDQVERMVGPDSYRATLVVSEKVDMEYNRLIGLARPKKRGKALELPEEHLYDESDFGACDACLS